MLPAGFLAPCQGRNHLWTEITFFLDKTQDEQGSGRKERVPGSARCLASLSGQAGSCCVNCKPRFMLVEEMTNVAVSGHLPGLQQHILHLQRCSWHSLGGGKDPLLSVGSAPLEKQALCAPGPTPLIPVL